MSRQQPWVLVCQPRCRSHTYLHGDGLAIGTGFSAAFMVAIGLMVMVGGGRVVLIDTPSNVFSAPVRFGGFPAASTTVHHLG